MEQLPVLSNTNVLCSGEIKFLVAVSQHRGTPVAEGSPYDRMLTEIALF